MQHIIDRFISYVTIDTESDANSETTPSTKKQLVLANLLVKELKSIGLTDVTIDKNGYVMGTLESNVEHHVPTIGFVSHYDTTPDFTGKDVKPQIIKNYDGRDAFVIKMDPTTGKPIWGKHAGSNKGSERGNDIVADDKCNVYVCGDIDGGAKFGDKILTPTGKSIEAFVARISPEGKWRWVATGGGIDSNDRSNAIAKGRNGQLYTCGFFRSPANYDTSNLISTGKSDGFLAQLYDSMANSLSPFDLHSPTDSIICKGESITLIIPDNAYFDYNPKTDASYTTANHQLVFSPNSTTTYTLIALGKEQCPSYDTISFTIHIAPDPIANFFINPQPALITNPVLNLSNQTINGSTYQWIYNNAVFATTNDAQYTAASEGNYCFSLVAYSNEQCVDTITKCGDVIKLQEVYLASVFTPNADGVNDVFKVSITNLNLTEIKDFSMIIANRFGEEIYHSKNIMDGWNGK